jgi:hypothetical protein
MQKKIITSHTYDDLRDDYTESYRNTGNKEFLIYLGMVELLKTNGYFEVAYVFSSLKTLVISGRDDRKISEHNMLCFTVSETEKRCNVRAKDFIDNMHTVIYAASIEIENLRLFQFKFLLFLSQYIQQTKEFRHIDINEYLQKDFFPVEV